MREAAIVPEVSEMEWFFNGPAVETDDELACRTYEATDSRGVRLRFTCAEVDQWVEVLLELDGRKLMRVGSDGLRLVSLGRNVLSCELSPNGARSRLVVTIGDRISVEWGTVETA